jgi:hypothetical protein
MPDFLDEKRTEITERLRELKPLIDEYSRLEAAAAALAGVAAPPTGPVAGTRRAPGRPPGSARKAQKAATATGAKRAAAGGRVQRRVGRRKGSGTRAAEALVLVQSRPGITIPELAARMGIKQNYLYRVMPTLEEGGRVKKRGRGWHPAGR